MALLLELGRIYRHVLNPTMSLSQTIEDKQRVNATARVVTSLGDWVM